MKKLIIPIVIILFLVSCATTNIKPNSNLNENSELTTYNSYLVKLSLKENKNLLNQLNNGLITSSEYDSLLTNNGRIPTQNLLIENCICNTNKGKSYEEVLRADYFFKADSLIHIVERKMEELTKIDSAYTMPYVYLCIIKYDHKNIPKALKYADKALQTSVSFENSGLNILKSNIYKYVGKYFEASKEYEIAFNKNDNLLKDNWSILFELYLKSKQLDKAENLFNKAEIYSKNREFKKNNLQFITDLHWDRGKYKDSQILLESLRDSTNSDFVDKELFNLLIMQKKFNEAKKRLLDLSSINLSWYSSPNFTFPKFDSLDAHYQEAFSKLKQSLDVSSNNSDANFCYGFLIVSEEMNKYYQDIDDELIRKGLAFIKKSNFSDTEINYIIGFINLELGNQSEALEYFSKIQNESKYYPYALINRAIIIKEKDIVSSISLLIDAEKILSNEPLLIEKIGDYYYDSKDYNNSIIWYNKLLEIDQNNFLVGIYLSKSYLYSDQPNKALSSINKTIDNLYTAEDNWSKDWNISRAYETKGDINQKLEKWEQSKRDYENSIKYNPNDMDPRIALANVYYKLKEYSSAEITYLTVIDSVTSKENIDYNTYNEVLGNLNLHYIFWEPNPGKRSKLFEKAIIYFPESDWCYRMLGWSYKDQDNYYKAVRNLKKAIELNPDSQYNYYVLAETYELEGTIDKAIEYYKYAIRAVEKENLKIDRENESEDYQVNLKSIGEYHSKIAKLYKEKEDYDLAILEYQRAISVTPDTTGIIYKFELASVYFENNDFNDAINNWQLVYEQENHVNALFNIGLSYLNLGDPESLKKSKTTFIELLDKIEGNPDFIDSKTKAEYFIEIIDEESNRIEWPEIIERLSNSDKGVTSEIAKLYKITSQYNEINDKWIAGIKETTPNKEYLEYSKEWIITSYNVSPKIFQSENLCDRFKAKLSSLTITNSRLKEVQSLWISSADSRKEGISEHSKGYYVKSKDYAGEYERGRAKIDVSDEYYADGLKILRSLMHNNIEHFSDYGIETIDDMIKYYEHKE